MAGNFSNGGRDTFDPQKQFIGIRLQQGVPLLDRDWNELEDIRRHYEEMLRRHYVGEGVPDLAGFRIFAPEFPAPGDFVIGAGRCMANGFDLWNPRDLLYSEQPGIEPLPAAAEEEVLKVYVEPAVVRIDAGDDPDLQNAQDVNLETCVRDRLTWTAGVARVPAQPPAGAYVLAQIRRPAGSDRITGEMITDLRRTELNLAGAVDALDSVTGRVGALEQKVHSIQVEIAQMKRQLARLFWDLRISASKATAYFGAKVPVQVQVVNGLGEPVQGAYLAFSCDWGVLDPATAVTNAQGKAAVELVGVQADSPLPHSHVALLARAVEKVERVTLPNPGSIQYAQLRFEPEEMALVSLYSPAGAFTDLTYELPSGPLVAQPRWRTVTVTVHAKEGGEETFVRGVGSLQVSFGHWVRDWARTKVAEVVGRVSVGERVGDVMRQGVAGETFDSRRVTDRLPQTMQAIYDDTEGILRASLFVDAGRAEEQPVHTGLLGQVIAQEATAAVGAKTNQAIERQIERFREAPDVPLDTPGARAAKTQIVQASSQISAGFSQVQKQRFSSSRGF